MHPKPSTVGEPRPFNCLSLFNRKKCENCEVSDRTIVVRVMVALQSGSSAMRRTKVAKKSLKSGGRYIISATLGYVALDFPWSFMNSQNVNLCAVFFASTTLVNFESLSPSPSLKTFAYRTFCFGDQATSTIVLVSSQTCSRTRSNS